MTTKRKGLTGGLLLLGTVAIPAIAWMAMVNNRPVPEQTSPPVASPAGPVIAGPVFLSTQGRWNRSAGDKCYVYIVELGGHKLAVAVGYQAVSMCELTEGSVYGQTNSTSAQSNP